MNANRQRKPSAGGDGGQPSFILFYLTVAASGFGIAATFGYLAALAATNAMWLHAAGHSAVTAFGAITTGTLVWQGITPRKR